MNNQELFEYMKSSHDYTIAEFQKSEQRIVDELQVMKLNIRSLEDSRTAAKWIIKTISKVAVALPVAGGILIKGWTILQKHKVLP